MPIMAIDIASKLFMFSPRPQAFISQAFREKEIASFSISSIMVFFSKSPHLPYMLPSRISCGLRTSINIASARPRYLPLMAKTSCARPSPLRAASATDFAVTNCKSFWLLQNPTAKPTCSFSRAICLARLAMPPPLQKPSNEPALPNPTGPNRASLMWPTSPAMSFVPL